MKPYKSQPVLYRAIAGDEYAAIVTDFREDNGLCWLATFPTFGGVTNISRIKYFESRADAVGHKGAACYPAI
jgi:hypothetical protein